MSEKSIVEQIKHYQRDIIKCPDNSSRMLRCIERLTVLPVKIPHLQETGVGRSVNELRKCGGEVGAAANALVCKWKSMVKDEKESDPESEIEESKEDPPSLADCKNNSPHKNSESIQKNKEVHNRDEQKKSVSSHSSSKKSDHSQSDRKSSKNSDHKSSNKSDHYSSRDKITKSGYSSSSDSKYSSLKSKSDHKSRSQEKTHSGHRSESECNGSIKSDRSHSKTKNEQTKSTKYSSTSDGKTRDVKQKYDKENSRKEESSHSSSYGSSKKYDLKRLESDSSDDDSIYKPSNPSSRKRKKSHSEEDEKKYENNKRRKNSHNKESSNKRNYESSDESNSKSESNEDDEQESRGNVESKNNSESDVEMSNRSEAEDNVSDNEVESEGKSSAQESEESHNSENNDESDENSDSPEREIYVPVKVKREKESPPKHSKSSDTERSMLKSNSVKNTHSSSSHSNKYKASDITVKKEERYESVKIKKEKVDKDTQNVQRQKEDKSSNDKKIHKSSSSHSASSSKHSNKTDKKVKIKIEKAEDGSIDCESGASFADALLGLSDSTKKGLKKKSSTPNQVKSPRPAEKSLVTKLKSSSKPEPRSSSSSSTMSSFKEPDLLSRHVKLEPLDVDLKATLPEITPNYKPLPHFSPPDSPAYKGSKFTSQEDALSSIMSTKNQRTKVYSGNKSGYTKVPSLFDLCIQVLRENIEALEYTGGVPYDLLKPVLDRATADQLYQLEHYNPYLVEDTDGLWQFHCNKEFRNKKPDEFETWRELYLRLLDEREKKLVALKANITQSMAKSTPIRQTKLAYVDSVVKPPRNIARKQMKYGTSKAVKHELVSKAMVGAAGSTPATEAAVPVPAPSKPHLSTSSFPIPNFLKKKKAPLMAKTLQLLKGNRFKR